MKFTRYGVYYVPGGGFGDRGAAWLGRDLRRGRAVAQPEGLAEITQAPRRYGFHATIKPPFRLAEGQGEADLRAAFAAFCGAQKPVHLEGLQVAAMGRFLALVPVGEVGPLNALAGATVEALDPFRAPATQDELERRRGRLTAAQEANLLRWGYPYVMEAFRFHLTLTDRLDGAARETAAARAGAHFSADLAGDVEVHALSLVGEGDGGRFYEVMRCGFGAG
ncbi:MAG: DUF1045 domain-containing protein [Sulfitobacter sp.]|nr:DUF1045 domain-containing protein [Sulfitobacter sp.]